jgi:hypothetical protein
VPPQAVHGPGALSDEIVAVIEQRTDLHRLLVQIRDRELLETVLDDRSGDRERVDLLRLARLALPFAGSAHPLRRDAHDPFPAASSACSSRRETCRQSSIAHTRSSSRSRAQRTATRWPPIVSLDLAAAAPPPGSLIERCQRARALVRVRPGHDHMTVPSFA